MEDDEKMEQPSSFGNAPESAGVGEDHDEFMNRCETDRDSLSPRETSDCAGMEIAEAFENEEDGGS